MGYTKTVWVNGASPPINAPNLNKIEIGIEEAHTQKANLSGGNAFTGAQTIDTHRISRDTGWKTVTIPTSAWNPNNTYAGFNREARISDATCTVDDIVNIRFGGRSDPANSDAARAAGITSESYESDTGAFGIFSVSVPTRALTLKYRVNK